MIIYRILYVLLFALFTYSSSVGQNITDIDRTKKVTKKKKEKKVTSASFSTSTKKKKVGVVGRKKEEVFSISSDNVQFDSKGGSKVFYITANNSWYISNYTKSWGTLTKEGDKLTLFVNPNTSTNRRTDFFELSSGTKTIRVDISQSGEPMLSISSNTANFDSKGGVKSFTVSSNGSWQIKTYTKSWGHLTREGNSLTLRVDANTFSTYRTDYFELSSGSKTVRVYISQSAGETSLSLSTQSLYFSSSGGTQTIAVSTNGTWDIELYTASWGHLVKSGNQLLVKVDANNSSSSRSDYFKIKAGEKTLQVNISQSGTNKTYSFYNQTNRQQRHNRVMANGGYVKFGFEIIDFGVIIDELSSNPKDIMMFYYNLGLSVKFGNYKSPVQFEIGVKPGVVNVNYDEYETSYGYTYPIEVNKNYFHMPIFAKLKINICNVNSSKFYIAGIGSYNAIRDKIFEKEYSAGGGFGFAWKKWDWFTYYKQDIGINNNFIGISLVRYF